MDIIKSDFKTGKVLLRITDLDDIWYLSQLIDPGDVVKGKTTRKMKIGDNENAKTVKKTLTLTVEAEQITIGSTADTLRVNGKVQEETQDIPKDSYHTITLEEGSEFTLTKPSWLQYQKQKLKEASAKKYNYLILLLDRDEALFATTKKFGYNILAKIKGDVPKKGKKTDIQKDFHSELLKALESYEARLAPQSIIIASPAFYKEELARKIKDVNLAKKIILATCSSVKEQALDEVMARPELQSILKDSRARQDLILIDELLTQISNEGLATYGMQEVTNAINAGAVSKLLITDQLIKKHKEENTFANIDTLMKHIDTLKGQIHLLTCEFEAGKKLQGLGGIAAILRYKL